MGAEGVSGGQTTFPTLPDSPQCPNRLKLLHRQGNIVAINLGHGNYVDLIQGCVKWLMCFIVDYEFLEIHVVLFCFSSLISLFCLEIVAYAMMNSVLLTILYSNNVLRQWHM
jgi:hypothetical protein